MGNDDATELVIPSRCPRCEMNTVAIVPNKQLLRCYNPDCGGSAEPAFEIPLAVATRAPWIRYMAHGRVPRV